MKVAFYERGGYTGEWKDGRLSGVGRQAPCFAVNHTLIAGADDDTPNGSLKEGIKN